MPTPKAGYRLADGSRVPSVTTIIGRFKESGGLIHWAWELGMAGKDYRKVRDEAADAGTMAHAAVEAWLHKRPYEFSGDPDICKKASKCFDAFIRWTKDTKIEVAETETPLVSEKHRYGGTLDAILIVGNKRALGDWKTSNRIYGEYLVQLAAYGKLWEENYPTKPIDGGFHLLRFDKEFADFHHHWWEELDTAWQAFLRLRDLYDFAKELDKRAS